MNTILRTEIHSESGSDSHNIEIFSPTGLGLAGLLGGPIAIFYLTLEDLKRTRQTSLNSRVIAWFGPFIALWLFCIFYFPPDLLSQSIVYFPQVPLWWLTAKRLLSNTHSLHQVAGKSFRSKWAAVRFGVFTFLALKVIFFSAAVLFSWLPIK
jgi:hypothetical protein